MVANVAQLENNNVERTLQDRKTKLTKYLVTLVTLVTLVKENIVAVKLVISYLHRCLNQEKWKIKMRALQRQGELR